MTTLSDFWSALGRGAKFGLVAGMLAIAALFSASGWWLLRTDYQVLFADLKAQDAASIVAELDKMKVAYRLADDGATVLVDGTSVHATRLKLMGRELPLHGAVGFELFNNADFGMTEFVQKINYQRALQGEITRTILSLAEVRDVRVHLALPEEGLFKRAAGKAKAAITLSLKPGQSLRQEQISGIQRLVSAAVPGIAAQDVTLVDQQGIALTRSAAPEGEAEPASGRLDMKKETEQLLARKATEVLDRTFGPGQAIASVDVVLNLDQVRTTTEDVLGAPARAGQGSSGVMVREREVLRESAAPLDVRRDVGARSGGGQREVEYQVGRRIEQVVSLPGAIRKLQLVAVVRRPVDAAQLEQLRALLGAAVGAVPDRGDVVVVQSLAAFDPVASEAQATGAVADRQGGDEVPAGEFASRSAAPKMPAGWTVAAVLAAFVALVLVMGVARVARARAATRLSALTPEQRELLVRQVQAWLGEEPGVHVSPPPKGAAGNAAGRFPA